MGTLQLRRATERDLDTVLGLIDEAASWLRGKDTDQWRKPWPNLEARNERVRVALAAGQTWIVWDGDTAAATVSMDREGNPKLWDELELHDRAVYVQRLVVARKYAGMGLGAQLIDWAGTWARMRYRAAWIRIDVWTTNESLHRYYEAHGFVFKRFCAEPDYPAGALLQKATKVIKEPETPLFEEFTDERSPSARDVLAYRNFRLYVAGNAAANLGTWLQNTAQILLVYRLTGSAFAVGLLMCARFSGPPLLAPWTEALAQRVSRRRLLIAAQLASATVAGGLAALQFSGDLTEPLLITGALTLGVAHAFTSPARRAVIPALVPRAKVEAARAVERVSAHVGMAVAPVIGIAMVTFAGFEWAFAGAAMAFLVLAAALMGIQGVHPVPAGASRRQPRLRDGFRLARDNRRILLLLVMVAAATTATDPTLVLGPALARQIGGPDVLAGFFVAALGAGTLLGSYLPGGMPSLRAAARLVGALGVIMVFFSLATQIWLSLLAALMAGGVMLLAGASTRTLLLAEAGPENAGRVMAAWAVAFAGSRPIASLIDGWLAGLGNVRLAGVFLEVPALIIGALSVPVVAEFGRTRLLVYRPAAQ